MGTEILAIAVTIGFTIVTSLAIGQYMFKVFTGRRTLLDPAFVPIERLVLRVVGADPADEQTWKQYAGSLLASNVVMWLVTFAIVSLQGLLPLNPDGIAAMEPTLSFNTISSFMTNTNLQHYSGETGSVVLLADVRDHIPAVRHGGHWHRGVHRHHPRAGRQPPGHARQLLRRLHAGDGASAAAAGAAGGDDPPVAGHADDLRGRGARRRRSRAPSR